MGTAVPDRAAQALKVLAMLLRMLVFYFLISMPLAYPSGSASANDTVAAVGVGGLVFKKSAHIEMRSEELFVSLDQIVVKYHFRNNASDDVTTVVAFPLPEMKYDPNDPEHDHAFSFAMFDGFTTIVDNQVVHASIEEKPMHGGIDETSTLNRYGIPTDPWAANDTIGSTDGTTKEQLHRLSLIDDHDHPTWSLIRTYYWEQRFPAGREVVVEHRYKPIVGSTVVWRPDIVRDANDRIEFYKEFCVDKRFFSAIKEKTKIEPIAKTWWAEQWIEYVLTTGANWSGPIRKFRLVVDKSQRDNLVSFCGEGIRKVGATQYELRATDFVPQKDLKVLILELPSGVPCSGHQTLSTRRSEASCQCIAPQILVSPDKALRALIYPVDVSLNATPDMESRIVIRSSSGNTLTSKDYSSPRGTNGYYVDVAKWSPDSQFFVYSMMSSGGHSPWSFPIMVYDRKSSLIAELSDMVDGKPMLSGRFDFSGPHTVIATTWRHPGSLDDTVSITVDLERVFDKMAPSTH